MITTEIVAICIQLKRMFSIRKILLPSIVESSWESQGKMDRNTTCEGGLSEQHSPLASSKWLVGRKRVECFRASHLFGGRFAVIGVGCALMTTLACADELGNAKKLYANGDYEQAAKLFEVAALQGNVKAQSALGILYEHGLGVPADDQKAVLWYRKAAEQGAMSAQDRLGLMYSWGRGVKQDFSQAANWQRKAAEQGFADAQFHLGVLYDQGTGVEQNYEQAATWYRKAAAQIESHEPATVVPPNSSYSFDASGHAPEAAAYNLGMLSEYGRGTPVNFLQAELWYSYAAKRDLPTAQFKIGLLQESGGFGVTQSYQAAATWYQLAADRGYALAQRQLEYLRSNKQTPCQGNGDELTKSFSQELPLKPGLWKFQTFVTSNVTNDNAAGKNTCMYVKSICVEERSQLATGQFWPELEETQSEVKAGQHITVIADSESGSSVTVQGIGPDSVLKVARTRVSDKTYLYTKNFRIGPSWLPTDSIGFGQYSIDSVINFSGECSNRGTPQ